jgi:hypothetical protein
MIWTGILSGSDIVQKTSLANTIVNLLVTQTGE